MFGVEPRTNIGGTNIGYARNARSKVQRHPQTSLGVAQAVKNGMKIDEKCKRCADRALMVSFWGNLSLVLLKATIGLIGGSKGLLADALHSASDALLSLVAMVTTSISKKPPDENHPYGHGKIEFITASIIGIFLFGIATMIFIESFELVLAGGPKHPPKMITLWTALFAALCSFLFGSYALCPGRKVNSPVLIANSSENRADALSSVGVAVGIVLSIVGLKLFDPLAAIVVSFLIYRASIHIFSGGINGLIDASIPGNLKKQIAAIIQSVNGVKCLYYLRARQVGTDIALDTGIMIDPAKTVSECHDIIAEVRSELRRRFENIHDVIINVHTPQESKRKQKISELIKIGILRIFSRTQKTY
ncbi:MAG: cation diffusion facilitator family transporter [bacterium]